MENSRNKMQSKDFRLCFWRQCLSVNESSRKIIVEIEVGSFAENGILIRIF